MKPGSTPTSTVWHRVDALLARMLDRQPSARPGYREVVAALARPA